MLPHIVSIVAFLLIIAVVCGNHVSASLGRVKRHTTLVNYVKFFGTFAAMILVPSVIIIGLFGSDYNVGVVFTRLALAFSFALAVGIVINGFDDKFLKATEKYVAWLR